MKTRYFLLGAMSLLALPMAAQETYENAKLTTQNLNGTARYVGMGGAMEALGADISTISTNPAGIGMFRHSTVNASGGIFNNYSGGTFDGSNKVNASFDQGGFVYSMRSGRKSFLNFAFNYHKSRNFDYILKASGALHGASQNRQSYLKGLIGNEQNGGFNVDQNTNGEYIGYVDGQSENTAYTWSQLDYLYWNTVIPDVRDGNFYSYDASGYNFARKHTGYIGNYDFNISGNANDRIYWGLTFGLKDVHYHGYSAYIEDMANVPGNITVTDRRDITGTGFDITGGVIIRPIEDSPFRFGLYVKTPTWYDLTTKNYTTINNGIPSDQGGTYDNGHVGNAYDYKFYTPWKFGVSLGHTVGDYLALGATYEYEDYGSIKSRIIDDDYFDGYDYYEDSHNDKLMNDHTGRTLKGVSTIKVGAEVKPITNLAIRVGYNYVSPAYNKNGQKDPTIPSLGTSYQSASDFVNWKATNRVTFGAGYQVGKFNMDLAYQYSTQNGDFYPFSNVTATKDETNGAPSAKVKDEHGQLIFTLGYSF